jgi:hypothetical protein
MDAPAVDLRKRTVTIGTDVYQFVQTERPERFYVHRKGDRVGSASWVGGGVVVEPGTGFPADLLSRIGGAFFAARKEGPRTEPPGSSRRPAPGVKAVARAACATCGREIEGWRERFTPVREGVLVVAEPSAMLALRVRAPGACSCGGEEIEIRVQDAL